MAVDPDRKAVKEALKAAGLTNGQVRALLSFGWKGVVDTRDAELAEALDQIEEMSRSLSRDLERQ